MFFEILFFICVINALICVRRGIRIHRDSVRLFPSWSSLSVGQCSLTAVCERRVTARRNNEYHGWVTLCSSECANGDERSQARK